MHHTTLISSSSFKPSCIGRPAVLPLIAALTRPLLGHQQYVEAHIPGAIYASRHRIDAHGGPSASGARHPLAHAEVFAQCRQVGMTNVTQAVVMDRNGANYCGRWMLKRPGTTTWLCLTAGCRPGGIGRRWSAAKGHTCRGQPDFQVAPSRYLAAAADTIGTS
jgi:thiosulfate/3-mercaptopyruvate sulfurtransferase